MYKVNQDSLGLTDPTPLEIRRPGDTTISEESTSLNVGDLPPESELDVSNLPTTNASFNSEEVRALAKVDLDFLAAISMPDVYKYAFPDIFKALWIKVLERLAKVRDFTQLALGLPRGFGKTLVIKLIILYAILFTKKQFILIICESEAKAISILGDVEDMLNDPNIKTAFGDWAVGCTVNAQTRKIFGFRGRNIVLKAVGAGTGIRGITEKNRRPDLMIFDDIQSKEASESELQSENLEKWMYGTAMKAKSPEGCLFLFIANMYPTKGSLLRKIKTNANWEKYIVGGIISNPETGAAQSLWEELQPLEQLLKEFQNDLASGHPEIFYSEVLNDENASVNSAIDLSKIPPYPHDRDDIPTGKYIIVDPSNNKATRRADTCAVGYFEVYQGYPSLISLIDEKLSPEQIIRRSLELALKNNCRLIVVESNAFQYTLLYWFDFICRQQGIIGIEAKEIYSGSLSKSTRILSMFKQLTPDPKRTGSEHVEITIHPDVRPEVYTQISQYNPLLPYNNDGILDLLTYAPKVLQMYPAEVNCHNIIDMQESYTNGVQEDNCVY